MPEALDNPNAPGLWAWYDACGQIGFMELSGQPFRTSPGSKWVLVRAAEPELPQVELFYARHHGKPAVFVRVESNSHVIGWRCGANGWYTLNADFEDLTDIRQLYPITREVAERLARRVCDDWGCSSGGNVAETADAIMEELG